MAEKKPTKEQLIKQAETQANTVQELVMAVGKGGELVLEHTPTVISVGSGKLVISPMVKMKWDAALNAYRDALADTPEDANGYDIMQARDAAQAKFICAVCQGEGFELTPEWLGENCTEGDLAYLEQAAYGINTALPFGRKLEENETDGKQEPT